jgi:hypothetical protein
MLYDIILKHTMAHRQNPVFKHRALIVGIEKEGYQKLF